MWGLRTLSVVVILIPALIGALITMLQSYLVSWIFAIAALASIPVIGLPLGIGVNLKRLDWPPAFIIPVVFGLSLTTLGWLFPKGQGGADKLLIPLLLLTVEYLACLVLSESSLGWSTEKRLWISLLMVLPIAPGALKGLWQVRTENIKEAARTEKDSVHLRSFVFRRGEVYDSTPESYFANYHLNGETSKAFTRLFYVDLLQKKEAPNAQARARKFLENKKAGDELHATTVALNASSPAVLIRTHFQSDGRKGAILLIDSAKGVLGYWLNWKGLPDSEMESDVAALLDAAVARKLPLPRSTSY